MPPVSNPAWKIECRCKWCGETFVRMEIDRARAWVCPTEACRERQLAWKRVDLGGSLMYLPVPVQVELHEAVASQGYGAICIGGHRGSSKSIAVRHVLYNACLDETKPEFLALLFRRLLTDLYLNQGIFFEREAPRIGAKYSAKSVFFEKTHSQLLFAHSKDPKDYEKYIGGDVDLIVLEQIEEFLQNQVVEINAATGRSTRYPHWRGLLLATENPGGPLSDFVNQIFVRKDLDRAKYPHYDASDYHFIEARLEDNPWTDPRYEQKLAILAPARREMFRHGRRDVFEGQFFQDFLRDSHVAEVDTRGAKWFGSLRWGFNDPGYFLLWAILPDRRLYVRGCLRLEQMNEDAAMRAAKTCCAECGVGIVPLTYANPEIFSKPVDDAVRGQSIAETLQYHGASLVEGDADDVNGWKRIHALLRESPHGSPWLRIHPGCEDLIHAIANAMSDDKDADVLDKQSPNRAALIALRLGAMSRPAPDATSVKVTYPPYSAGWLLERAMREERRAS